MTRPIYPDPVAPTLESPLYEATSGTPCGQTYRSDVEIRYPYGETDVFVRELPRVWDMTLDIQRAYPDLEERIEIAIVQTGSDLDAYGDSGDVSEGNFEQIDEILELATEYVRFSSLLRVHWAGESLEYVDSGGLDERDARGWISLGLSSEIPTTLAACSNQEPGDVIEFKPTMGGWVKYKCGGLGMAQIYAEDWKLYKDTLIKAAKQVRCAQEALYSLVAFNVNRLNDLESSLQQPSGPEEPQETLRTSRPPDDGEQYPAPLPPSPAPTGWSKRQKVGMVVLGIGALGGLAYLLTRGWYIGTEANPRNKLPIPLPPRGVNENTGEEAILA